MAMGNTISHPSCHRPQRMPGLYVELYRTDSKEHILNRQPLYYACEEEYLVEDLCFRAASTCDITPPYVSMFGLVKEDLEGKLATWLSPSAKVSAKKGEKVVLVFRLRFKFANLFEHRRPTRHGIDHNQNSTVLDENAMSYYFLQAREDFLSGRIKILRNNNKEKAIEQSLGLAVLDMLRISLEQNVPVDQIKKQYGYKDLLPPEVKDLLTRYNPFNRNRIKSKFNGFLQEWAEKEVENANRTALFMKEKYLKHLEQVEGRDYGWETFEGYDGRSKGTSVKELIRVSGDTGISWCNPPEGDPLPGMWQNFCDFQNLNDVSVQEIKGNLWEVILNRLQGGGPKVLHFKDSDVVVSLLTLIDGYHRLLVDSYHYFWKDIAPPSLLILAEIKAHGSIMRPFAEQKIEKHGSKPGTYVLRAHTEIYGNFFLNVCFPGGEIKNFQVVCQQREGRLQYSMEPNKPDEWFDGMKELVSNYGRNTVGLPFRFDRCLPPKRDEKTNLTIRRVEDAPPPPSPRPLQPAMPRQLIQENNLIQEDNLYSGKFTTVHKGRIKQDGMSQPVVAIKRLKDENWFKVFHQSASKLQQWDDKHIIRMKGLCVDPPIMVLEYARFGALGDYLRTHKVSVELPWLLTAAHQLASVMLYLESKGFGHGGLCAQNVLVANETPFIKLGDPGIGFSAEKKKRLLWLAPEVVFEHKDTSPSSDKFSYGTTLWEIFNYGAEPLSVLAPETVQQLYTEGSMLKCPDNCPESVYWKMRWFWQKDPLQRPEYRAMLRTLNHPDVTDQSGPPAVERLGPAPTDDTWPIFNGNIDLFPDDDDRDDRRIHQIPQQDNPFVLPPPVPMDPPVHTDQKFSPADLKFQKELGSGYFGRVDLYSYDPYGRECKDDPLVKLFAVKSVKRNAVYFDKNPAKLDEYRKDFLDELKLLKTLSHPNIIQVIGTMQDSDNEFPALVLEYMEYGSLEIFLRKWKANIQLDRQLRYALQVAQGMEYLHGKHVLHRDLAARNILVAHADIVKISDFGLSRELTEGTYYSSQKGIFPINWYAPEALDKVNKYQKASDVWSYGVTVWEILSLGKKPEYSKNVGGDNEIEEPVYDKLQRGERLVKPEQCPDEVYAVVNTCWKWVPQDRPSFSLLVAQFDELSKVKYAGVLYD
ncbi:PREDICTED: tyrosine-protein kinase JAK2-like [Branchiostoma belcheri]|uniref:Tyrosine-protein kinase n=1 Tax=Branchiostoma belcheri TaxID=7741 RepID=A0A6P4Y8U5_BRABE|nr:PREDICTED: tyrosine-protein kinase JAK2-like [Branchiostoma belcheri]XP_019615218.1 PREDICTED: tyrosine-protein kinase JAK2-like [Branchiostoma belcheri]XP_019615219.1 PREDICTED: tyrosine-protein kinase JAK2-like [Branchiostoma belcheri]